MARTVEALVVPEVLAWARQDAGLDSAAVAQRVGVAINRIEDWESGRSRPTISQLRKAAGLFGRPLAFFYLEKPPEGLTGLADYRHFDGSSDAGQTPALRKAIRMAARKRSIAVDLWLQSEADFPAPIPESDHSVSPTELATLIRDFLEVGLKEQCAWKNDREAFRTWKEAFEAKGIFVFQTSGVSTSEMRGIALAEFPLPAILVNSSDTVHGRIFSLFHELAHLVLRQGALCNQVTAGRGTGLPTEQFCNQVAGEALVPKAALLTHPVTLSHRQSPKWGVSELNRLSACFSVSREVVLRRLLDTGRTNTQFYRAMRTAYVQEYKKRKSSGRISPARASYYASGPLYVNLVLSNYYNDRITLRDVSDYLGVRLKHLSTIESLARGETR